METKTAKELKIRFSGDLPDKYVVVTNKDEIDLENANKIFLLVKTDEIESNEDEVSIFQTEFDKDMQMVKPLVSNGKLLPLGYKYKDDLIVIII